MTRGAGALAALLSAALTAGCSGIPFERGPRLEAQWSGADTAHFSAAATAEWCDSLKVLQVTGARGDTGIGLAIFAPGGLSSGNYPIRLRAPLDTLSVSRELSAALGLRWFSRALIRGFRGDSGQLVLHRAPDGRLDGSFVARAHGVYDDTRLHVTGSFRGLRTAPATRGCRRPAPRDSMTARGSTPPPDTGEGVN